MTAPVKKFLLQRVDLINTILAFWKKSPSLSLNSQQQSFSFGNLNQPALIHHPSSQLHIPVFTGEAENATSDEETEEINIKHIKRSSNQSRVRYRVSDTTKILVDLYGSEEDFLDEYQNDIAIKFLLDKKID